MVILVAPEVPWFGSYTPSTTLLSVGRTFPNNKKGDETRRSTGNEGGVEWERNGSPEQGGRDGERKGKRKKEKEEEESRKRGRPSEERSSQKVFWGCLFICSVSVMDPDDDQVLWAGLLDQLTMYLGRFVG